MGMRHTILLTLLTLAVVTSHGQERPDLNPKDTTDNSSTVKVKNADNSIFEQLDGVDQQRMNGNVKMYHDSIFMYADSALIAGNVLTATGEIIIIQDDSINVFSDSLHYDPESKLAKLFGGVILETGDKSLFTERLDYDLGIKRGVFRDTAILKREAMVLSSLRGWYEVDRSWATFYDQVVIKDTDFELTADSLDYDTDVDRAYFKGPTYITQKNRQVYCEAGYYDMISGQAFFDKNAAVIEGSKVGFAEGIAVIEADSTVSFMGNAEVRDSISWAKGETITFHDKTGEVEILGDAYYEQDDQIIEGEEIKYNRETEDFFSRGNTRIHAEEGLLTADTVMYNKASDLGRALGKVVWADTVDQRVMLADIMEYKENSVYVKAIKAKERPLFYQVVDEDTLYLVADTLLSEEPHDSLKYMKAYADVLIYKSDIQAVCDSLYYDDLDSTFTLFRDPICWSDTTQFTGDTINIQLANDEVKEIQARSKAFLATRHAGGVYDQIKGRFLHAFMDSSELERMNVKGNAEALYFLKDEEDAYIGVNKTLCSHMTFYFESEDLDNIRFYAEPESTMTPMAQAGPRDKELEGLRWEERDRPKGSEELRRLTWRKKETLPVPEAEIADPFEQEVLDLLDGSGELPPTKDPPPKTNNRN